MICGVRIILAAVLGAAVVATGAPESLEHGTLRLHYVQKPIGY